MGREHLSKNMFESIFLGGSTAARLTVSENLNEFFHH